MPCFYCFSSVDSLQGSLKLCKRFGVVGKIFGGFLEICAFFILEDSAVSRRRLEFCFVFFLFLVSFWVLDSRKLGQICRSLSWVF